MERSMEFIDKEIQKHYRLPCNANVWPEEITFSREGEGSVQFFYSNDMKQKIDDKQVLCDKREFPNYERKSYNAGLREYINDLFFRVNKQALEFGIVLELGMIKKEVYKVDSYGFKSVTVFTWANQQYTFCKEE